MSPGSIRKQGLPPVVGSFPRVLILGSFPSVQALKCSQYYGNPRNHFWRIMSDLFGIAHNSPYEERVATLTDHGIALWDVACSCRRDGSSDSTITEPVVNDLKGLLSRCPTIRHVALNGTKAEQLLRKELPGIFQEFDVHRFPSTSPANARLRCEEKLKMWGVICDWLERP